MTDDILALQQALYDLGVNPGPLDGRWGPATRAALRRAAAFDRMTATSPDTSKAPAPPQYRIEDLLDVARTVYGEARGESHEGKKAVAHVIANRARSYPLDRGRTLSEVCRRSWQFSCWNENDPNRRRIENLGTNDPNLAVCLVAVIEALSEPDPTGGATHYHAKSVQPRWAHGQVACYLCGGHLFYRGID